MKTHSDKPVIAEKISDGLIQRKIRKFKENWFHKTPKQKWRFSYGIGEASANLIGVRVLSDFGMNVLTYFGVCIGVFYTLTSIYTIQFYSKKGQFLIGIQCLCCIGWIISVKTVLKFKKKTLSI